MGKKLKCKYHMNASTKEQRKGLLHLLISEITLDESRRIDKIKIRFNKDIINYLSISEEEGLPADDSSKEIGNKLVAVAATTAIVGRAGYGTLV